MDKSTETKGKNRRRYTVPRRILFEEDMDGWLERYACGSGCSVPAAVRLAVKRFRESEGGYDVDGD